jgi:hypothetical protein
MRFICSFSCASSFVRRVRMLLLSPTSLVMILSSATRPLLYARQRAFVDPRQRGTQIGLVVFRLLALRGAQGVLFAVEHVTFPSGVITRLTVLAFHLHGLRASGSPRRRAG